MKNLDKFQGNEAFEKVRSSMERVGKAVFLWVSIRYRSTISIRDANLNVFVPFKLYGKFSGIHLGGENLCLTEGY
jgi:hypothetical protein